MIKAIIVYQVPIIGAGTPSTAGPLTQKQITVIQVPTLDKNKDKSNKSANKEELKQASVSHILVWLMGETCLH